MALLLPPSLTTGDRVEPNTEGMLVLLLPSSTGTGTGTGIRHSDPAHVGLLLVVVVISSSFMYVGVTVGIFSSPPPTIPSGRIKLSSPLVGSLSKHKVPFIPALSLSVSVVQSNVVGLNVSVKIVGEQLHRDDDVDHHQFCHSCRSYRHCSY
jgi:hypothetical protein